MMVGVSGNVAPKGTLPVALRVILLVFTLLGLVTSAVVPIFEASDELWHYPMVETLARTWTLPVQPLEPGTSSGPWRQEASQPPLYYAIGAALTFWIDTSDMAQVRHLNPHVAAGEVTPDRSNPNLVVHNPALERFPWRGTVLAVHIVRLFSVLLGTWAVYLTWALVRELYPTQPTLALVAAAIHAFTPMFLFISASVNNDNLVVPLCSLALLQMVRLVKRQALRVKRQELRVKRQALRVKRQEAGGKRQELRVKRQEAGGKRQEARGEGVLSCILHPASCISQHVLLGVVLGLGLLTKASAIGLLPLAAATVAWETWQEGKLRSKSYELRSKNQESGIRNQESGITQLVIRLSLFAIRCSLFVFLPAVVLSGWWFYRNFRLYGDWLGLNAFYAVLGTRDVTADLAQLWAERFAFAAGYWGNFGGLNVPMPTWIYIVLNVFAILAGINAVVRFLAWAASCELRVASYESRIMNHESRITHHESPIPNIQSPISNRHISNLWPFTWDALTAARALAWAWPAAVFVSWMRWATITWSSQGRLIFSAMPMWSLALALPMTNCELRITDHAKSIIIRHSLFVIRYSFPVFLFVLCLVALPAWIVPAYQPPRDNVTLGDVEGVVPHDRTFGGVMRLRGYAIDTESVQPGDPVRLTLDWEALAPTATDHSIFVHVLGNDERIIAQRDTFPGRGLVSTTWLEPGRTWREDYAITIPPLAYAPERLTFAVGMVETATGERLPVFDANGVPQGEMTLFGQADLVPRADPVRVHFGKGIVLAGYDLSDTYVQAGAPFTVTLHWEAAALIEGDYTISVQLIDAQWRKAAQSDAWPLDGAAPTSSWQVGQRIDEPRVLTLAADAVPGVYDLQLAIYRVGDDGQLEHLPIVWAKGQMPAKTVVLTRVRVQ